MGNEDYSEADLLALRADVEAILKAEGLPPGVTSNFATGKSNCKAHSQCIEVDLEMPDAGSVRIVHCGCDHWWTPVAPPPEDLAAMAKDLAEELVWYWNWREGAMELKAVVREAVEREIASARAKRLDWRLTDVSLEPFETFRGPRRPEIRVGVDLMHDNLGSSPWDRSFRRPEDVRKFFRGMRPWQMDLASRRDELARAGARGAIDKVGVAALRLAGWDPLDVIAELVKAKSLRFDVGEVDMVLSWRMGTIRALIDLQPGVRWEFGEVHFTGEYDFWSEAPFNRRPITHFVQSPLLPEDAPVVFTGVYPERMILRVDPPVALFGMADGRAKWIEEPG